MPKVLLALLFAVFLAAPVAAKTVTVICTQCEEIPYTEEELKEIAAQDKADDEGESNLGDEDM